MGGWIPKPQRLAAAAASLFSLFVLFVCQPTMGLAQPQPPPPEGGFQRRFPLHKHEAGGPRA